MATEEERQLFAEKVLHAVRDKSSELPESKVIGFMAMKGCRYADAKALMVVGRSVNGWDVVGILPGSLASNTAVEHYSQKVLASVKRANGDGKCPMRWVTDHWGTKEKKKYNTRRSAFWRVIWHVVGQLKIADIKKDSWPSHLVWTNLYKIAPEDGGNASATLARTQRPGCIELFQRELETYKPSRLLLLTGDDWASRFLHSLNGTWQDVREPEYVERLGTLSIAPDHRPILCVVAKHPQGK